MNPWSDRLNLKCDVLSPSTYGSGPFIQLQKKQVDNNRSPIRKVVSPRNRENARSISAVFLLEISALSEAGYCNEAS